MNATSWLWLAGWLWQAGSGRLAGCLLVVCSPEWLFGRRHVMNLTPCDNDLSAQACCVLTSPSNRQMARCRYCHSWGYVTRHQATRSKRRFGYCPTPNCCSNFYFKKLRYCARARRHPAPWQRPSRFSLRSSIIAVLFIVKLKRIRRRIDARMLADACGLALEPFSWFFALTRP